MDGEDNTDVYEYDNFNEIVCQMTLAVLYVLPTSLQILIISYVKNTVVLKSLNDDEAGVDIIPHFLCLRSTLFKSMFETRPLIYYFNTTTAILRLIVLYVHSHRDTKTMPVKKPLISAIFADNTLCKFDVWFASACDVEKNLLNQVIVFARDANITDLLCLLCAKTASKFKGVPFEKMRTAVAGFCAELDPMPKCSCGAH